MPYALCLVPCAVCHILSSHYDSWQQSIFPFSSWNINCICVECFVSFRWENWLASLVICRKKKMWIRLESKTISDRLNFNSWCERSQRKYQNHFFLFFLSFFCCSIAALHFWEIKAGHHVDVIELGTEKRMCKAVSHFSWFVIQTFNLQMLTENCVKINCLDLYIIIIIISE